MQKACVGPSLYSVMTSPRILHKRRRLVEKHLRYSYQLSAGNVGGDNYEGSRLALFLDDDFHWTFI